GRHKCQWCSGVRVIEQKHQDGAWQPLFPVFYIGAVPFHPRRTETSAQIGGHGHKAPVRGRFWHVGEGGVLRKDNNGPVRVVVGSCHSVVVMVQQARSEERRVGKGGGARELRRC